MENNSVQTPQFIMALVVAVAEEFSVSQFRLPVDAIRKIGDAVESKVESLNIFITKPGIKSLVASVTRHPTNGKDFLGYDEVEETLSVNGADEPHRKAIENYFFSRESKWFPVLKSLLEERASLDEDGLRFDSQASRSGANEPSMRTLGLLATELVDKFFKDKTDKGGKPYTWHLHRVAESVEREQKAVCSGASTLNKYYDKCYIVALLHDIIEDTSCSAAQLREFGFDDEIIAAVVAMTKRHNEDYFQYIQRVSSNDIACKVKIYDLEDNMDVRRLKSFSDKDSERLRKYWYCWKFLKGEIGSGCCHDAISNEKLRG